MRQQLLIVALEASKPNLTTLIVLDALPSFVWAHGGASMRDRVGLLDGGGV
jgi:hypothetical protein